MKKVKMRCEKEKQKQKLFLFLLCYAFFIVLFAIIFNDKVSYEMQPVRISWVNHYINNIANGEFPDFSGTNNNDHAYGIYLLASYLGYLLNLDGSSVFRILSIIFFIVVIVSFPFYIEWKTNNWVCAYMTPFILCIFYYDTLLLTQFDTYFALSVGCIFLGVPLIELSQHEIYRSKKILDYLLLIILISVTNIARLHVSLGLMIIVAFLLIRELVRDKKRFYTWIILLGLLLYFYNFLATKLPEIILRCNNREMLNITNTAWHNILIGFGTFDNPYNLRYIDECGWNIVHSIDPTIKYASNEYYLKCKELVMNLFSKDLKFCLLSFTKKTIFSVGLLGWCLIRGEFRGGSIITFYNILY